MSKEELQDHEWYECT